MSINDGASRAVQILKANPEQCHEETALKLGCTVDDLWNDPDYSRLAAEIREQALAKICKDLFTPNGPYPHVLVTNTVRVWSYNEEGKPKSQSYEAVIPKWLGKNNFSAWRTDRLPCEMTDHAVFEWQNAVTDKMNAEKEINILRRPNIAISKYKSDQARLIADSKLILALISHDHNTEALLIKERLNCFIETGAIVPLKDSSDEIREMKAIELAQRENNQRNVAILLMSVYSNGISDKRIEQALATLAHDSMTVNEKIERIDKLLPIPMTTSAEALAKVLGVTKQAVLKTQWWIVNRKGEKADLLGKRMARSRDRGQLLETYPPEK